MFVSICIRNKSVIFFAVVHFDNRAMLVLQIAPCLSVLWNDLEGWSRQWSRHAVLGFYWEIFYYWFCLITCYWLLVHSVVLNALRFWYFARAYVSRNWYFPKVFQSVNIEFFHNPNASLRLRGTNENVSFFHLWFHFLGLSIPLLR